MENKKVIKRKIKLVPVLLLVLIVSLIYLIIKSVVGIKIKNIYIINNQYLSDDYIIEKAGLKDYPSYFFTFSFRIRNKLENDSFIKSATVNKYFYGVVEIEIEENDILYYKTYDKKYVLEDKTEVDEIPYSFSPIKIVNYIPDTIYNSFLNKFIKLNKSVRSKISEIKYDPSEYDESRFMIYMVDGNYVYITLTKFDSLDYYNEIYPTLEGKKGILYLDSGNHFVEI